MFATLSYNPGEEEPLRIKRTQDPALVAFGQGPHHIACNRCRAKKVSLLATGGRGGTSDGDRRADMGTILGRAPAAMRQREDRLCPLQGQVHRLRLSWSERDPRVQVGERREWVERSPERSLGKIKAEDTRAGTIVGTVRADGAQRLGLVGDHRSGARQRQPGSRQQPLGHALARRRHGRPRGPRMAHVVHAGGFHVGRLLALRSGRCRGRSRR